MTLVAGAGLLAAGLVWSAVPASMFKARALVGTVPPVATGSAPRAISTDQFASPSVLRRLRDRLDAHGLAVVSDSAIVHLLSAVRGEVPGTLQIFAAGTSAERSATLANVAADAIVANQDETAHRAQAQREARDNANLARLRARATAARGRLAALGLDGSDQTQVLDAARLRASNARARVATIQAIMGTSPPLSDRSDLPPSIREAQSTYLDLTQELDNARAALGDRHTSILSLNSQVKRASARLTAEWQHLSQAADNEVTVSRTRFDALNKAMKPLDPRQADLVATARREIQAADEDLARAQRPSNATNPDEATYRVVTPASPPDVASGVPLVIRVLLAGIAALLVFAGGLRLPRRRRSPILNLSPADTPIIEEETASPAHATNDEADGASLPTISSASSPEADHDAASIGERQEASDEIAREGLPVTTIMVASNELLARTTPVALAIGRAAASEGLRVLIVETPRPVSTLASATEAIDPIIVDFYGKLRIALPADDDDLYLVPSLNGSERIAAELARRGETPVVGDITDEFDLVVIDGGCAADAAEEWRADVYLRVGASQSRMADALFATTFEIPLSALLDTVLEELVSTRDEAPAEEAESVRREAAPPAIIPLPPHLRPRHLVARRQSGTRHVAHGRR